MQSVSLRAMSIHPIEELKPQDPPEWMTMTSDPPYDEHDVDAYFVLIGQYDEYKRIEGMVKRIHEENLKASPLLGMSLLTNEAKIA